MRTNLFDENFLEPCQRTTRAHRSQRLKMVELQTDKWYGLLKSQRVTCPDEMSETGSGCTKCGELTMGVNVLIHLEVDWLDYNSLVSSAVTWNYSQTLFVLSKTRYSKDSFIRIRSVLS